MENNEIKGTFTEEEGVKKAYSLFDDFLDVCLNITFQPTEFEKNISNKKKEIQKKFKKDNDFENFKKSDEDLFYEFYMYKTKVGE